MRPISEYLRHPRKILSGILRHNPQLIKNDEIYLKVIFYLESGCRLNLKNPKTFCEKIQWLKINDRKSEYESFVDKYAVKQYVENIIGKEYIIPTLGVWDSVEDINITNLPNRFVLKTTHDGGGYGVVICNGKENFDFSKAKDKLQRSMLRQNFWVSREWAYKNIKHRIIAEANINVTGGDIVDYKFYCFNGYAKYCQVIKNRSSEETIDFYDRQWVKQPFCGLNPFAKPSQSADKMPTNYGIMIEIADKLSKSIPFARIDLYNISGKIYFGEITLYPSGGFGRITPDEWDIRLGELIMIP